MANEKDSRCPSVDLGHDDILEMLIKSCSGKRRVDMWTAIYLVSSSLNSGDGFCQKCPSKLVDKKSKSERKFPLGQLLNVHTCQMMIQLLT
jgi:hypothetical protein